ncbi:hypothetical protein LTR36_004948 [Oleoguttula mirabilis]|uniref:Uncharacterized protein n=1 Tax=Oleoguttula mirabilis TaxID=1507867 RepID=A0AAV9JX41_9PEZI|nr:hypothetical protein LTR36_004948 [Oleoguttula mirabilis]
MLTNKHRRFTNFPVFSPANNHQGAAQTTPPLTPTTAMAADYLGTYDEQTKNMGKRPQHAKDNVREQRFGIERLVQARAQREESAEQVEAPERERSAAVAAASSSGRQQGKGERKGKQ